MIDLTLYLSSIGISDLYHKWCAWSVNSKVASSFRRPLFKNITFQCMNEGNFCIKKWFNNLVFLGTFLMRLASGPHFGVAWCRMLVDITVFVFDW
jgi:hypothetical protein